MRGQSARARPVPGRVSSLSLKIQLFFSDTCEVLPRPVALSETWSLAPMTAIGQGTSDQDAPPDLV